jgi:hypothetical protein
VLKDNTGLGMQQGSLTADSQNKFWKEVLEEEVLLERQEINGKTEWGSLLPICSIQKYGVQWQDVRVIRGRKQGRPWQGYGPKSICNLGRYFYNNYDYFHILGILPVYGYTENKVIDERMKKEL